MKGYFYFLKKKKKNPDSVKDELAFCLHFFQSDSFLVAEHLLLNRAFFSLCPQGEPSVLETMR